VPEPYWAPAKSNDDPGVVPGTYTQDGSGACGRMDPDDKRQDDPMLVLLVLREPVTAGSEKNKPWQQRQGFFLLPDGGCEDRQEVV
jgi:hypothetical protein